MTASEPETRRLRKLIAELNADRDAVASLAAEVASLAERSRGQDDPAVHAALAFRLEQLYTAIESMLRRVAATIDGDWPGGSDWHVQLLKDMTLSIAEVRPAVLSSATAGYLRRLLALRHFLRQAYAVALDPEQLRDRARDAREATRGFDDDLDRFVEFLGRMVGRADEER
ncbi:MAG: hypothetical protein ACQEXJ_10270 [Myxococcota bacterium]